MKPPQFYKHSERGYFHKKRWPIDGLKSRKVSDLHHASFSRRTHTAMAGWSGRTGNGTLHAFDRAARRLVQVRKIENGYITGMYRDRAMEEFDTVWWHKGLDGRVAESG